MKRTENFAQLFVTFLCNPVAIRKVTRYKGNVTACEPQQGSGEKWKRGHRFESTLPPLLPSLPAWKNRRRFYRVERRRGKKKRKRGISNTETHRWRWLRLTASAYAFLHIPLSLSLSRIQPDRLFKSTLDFFPSFFVFFAVLFLLFLILSQRILDNCRCLGIRSYVGFICRKYGVIILRLGRRRDIARFILFYYRMN